MQIYKEKTGWNTVRFDSRTYTTQIAKEQESGLIAKIPQNYIFIDDRCFMGNGRLKEVVLPSHCRIIGKQAFEGCQFRKQVVFPKTLVEIKKRAFAENHNLRQAVFPESLKKLGSQCYRECNNLKKVHFSPDSQCREILDGTFDSCVRLNDVLLPLHIKKIGNRSFYRCKELKNIFFPDSIESKIFCASSFKRFQSIPVIFRVYSCKRSIKIFSAIVINGLMVLS